VARTHPEPPERHGGVLPESRRSLRRRASSPIDPVQEVIVNERRARELVARERTRVEALLAEQTSEIHADGSLQRQQTGESEDGASELDSESVSVALAADLREQLAAVGRAEERIAAGAYGRSVESSLSIPDERLEAEPLAERTIEEQRDYETHRSRRLP
jgi:RNA polymerase-binding transcription factor DksA